jgi:hypothetical protein
MADEAGPIYRSTGPSRIAAWITFLVAIGVAVSINGGGVAPASGVIGAILLVVAFLALSSLRFQVRAKPEHLVVCSGGPVRKIPWSEIKGFGVDEKRGRILFVELRDDRKMMLPVPEVRAGKMRAQDVRDDLARYWKAHRR